MPGATRTLLLYCHYDGQPVDREGVEAGRSVHAGAADGDGGSGRHRYSVRTGLTRFEPEWRLYARSASDDKSPIVAIGAAIDALKASALRPTSNVRVILDGEEEASSPSLVPAIARYRDKLRADLMVILDGPMHSSGRPTVVYGARGIVTRRPDRVRTEEPACTAATTATGCRTPPSGSRRSLASMKDDDGRVIVGGILRRHRSR